MQRPEVILGLGSNVGDRAAMLKQAVRLLEDTLGALRCSFVYESSALLPSDAPEEWDRPYLNMAVAARTEQNPESLLKLAKHIEHELGRKERGYWGPREIDIDVLVYDNAVIQTPPLTVPHAELLKRDFALLPLAELAPDWRYPVQGEYFGRTARELIGQLKHKLRRVGPL